MFDETDDTRTYVVVVNDEEQYSIWPTGRAVPLGWRELATRGPKQDCLAYIREVWTDMRPLSLRRAMDVEDEAQRRPERVAVASASRKVATSRAAKAAPSPSPKARATNARKATAAGSRKLAASAGRRLSASASRSSASKKAKRR